MIRRYTGPSVPPDAPVIVQLEQLMACGYHARCARIVVQSLPARAELSVALGARVAPDPAVAVQLIKRIDVQLKEWSPEPSMAGSPAANIPVWGLLSSCCQPGQITAAGRAGVAPDAPVVMHLEEPAVRGRERYGLRVVVQALPAGQLSPLQGVPV